MGTIETHATLCHIRQRLRKPQVTWLRYATAQLGDWGMVRSIPGLFQPQEVWYLLVQVYQHLLQPFQ